ncbi:valine--tRNA ligase [Leptospira bandrabouensis]|uniref:Valine--tRNA ligase n=1 Tax=Leptospira bandrabouensis TaxID=2484903 RepID=A0A6H3NYS0_9LEPT|nr:valine--tRNA ligase [Leptospira bandrabouensis]MCW7457237.1 valine--tRNA ligase [Leptospira bandrabouensis]MCW7476490.1 valine--tRNA ligase [Leptospira bandrabouensis]MCW7484172.1 valine--tRNA ligase [Leptospira bandrabouensis]TGN04975.1 valine--tRNA ligase [Leptospira bandrabouensis]TGN15305.1 valine--tRNA ligase [Leptospira bandrabouensis]
MKSQLPDRYDPESVEPKWIKTWEEKKTFAPDSSRKETFSIVIPPPNVTGNLHIGHALNHTIQDIIIRIERKKGKNVVWVPGMDHAGIATQVVVERELGKEGKSRTDFTREGFIEKVWEWKAHSGGMIAKQQRLLGESVDWSRERFTFDEGLSKAVIKVFRSLYDEGLIYRGERIINWCPVTKTAISDIEVEYKEKQGKLYHIKYPKAEFKSKDPKTLTKGEYIVVATTRPETMFGDVAVCAHPDDARYTDLKDKFVFLPIAGKEIPVLFDSFVDKEFGSGLVKITPAHDINDYEAGLRLKLTPINIMNLDGTLNEHTGKYNGLDRFEARKRVVEELEANGYIEKIETHIHSVGHNQRGGAVIEPLLSTQWFVKIESLAKPAIEVVKSGKVQFQPKMWEKTYFEWMENIRDWCISRQLWWGHRIPAYYAPNGEMVVAESVEEAVSLFSKKGISVTKETIKQDEDVLDTWFSSGLWPFTVFGWPENSEELKQYYPTSVLVTGFDIIFFWVARMIMNGLKFMGDVPFQKVLIHGLVRDKDGKKFSKSLGNVVDPLDMMTKYGTDSFRFFLAAVLPEGKDILFDESRLDGYRSFCNKIWNSSRFIFMNLPEEFEAKEPELNSLEDTDLWILNEFDRMLSKYEKAYSGYLFFEMANAVYDFVWGSFCDWYLELTKARVYGNVTPESQEKARFVLVSILKKSLGLLHPFMPFITEEIHSLLETTELAKTEFPKPYGVSDSAPAVVRMELVREIITKIRNMRAELGVKPEKKCKVIIKCGHKELKEMMEREIKSILQLSKAESLEFLDSYEAKNTDSVGAFSIGEIFLPLEGIFDFEKEKQRLEKEKKQIQLEMEKLENKINNPSFLEKAKPDVVEKEREKYNTWKEKLESTVRALEKIGS